MDIPDICTLCSVCRILCSQCPHIFLSWTTQQTSLLKSVVCRDFALPQLSFTCYLRPRDGRSPIASRTYGLVW